MKKRRITTPFSVNSVSVNNEVMNNLFPLDSKMKGASEKGIGAKTKEFDRRLDHLYRNSTF